MKTMTTKIYKWVCGCILCCGIAMSFSSCSDDFLAEKRPYGQFGENDIYND